MSKRPSRVPDVVATSSERGYVLCEVASAPTDQAGCLGIKSNSLSSFRGRRRFCDGVGHCANSEFGALRFWRLTPLAVKKPCDRGPPFVATALFNLRIHKSVATLSSTPLSRGRVHSPSRLRRAPMSLLPVSSLLGAKPATAPAHPCPPACRFVGGFVEARGSGLQDLVGSSTPVMTVQWQYSDGVTPEPANHSEQCSARATRLRN